MGGFSTAVPGPSNQGFDIKPPAIDPFANLRALAIQGQIAEQKQNIATQQQAMGTTALNQQLIQQKITDQQALGQALRDWDPNSSPVTMIKAIADNGGSGDAIAGFQQHIADMRLKNSQADEATLKAQQTRHDQLASQVQAVIDAKPENKQALYAQYLPQIRRELDPGDPIPPDVYPGDDWAGGQVKGHQLISAQTKQDLEKAQAGEAGAKGKQAEAEAGKATLEQQLTQHKLDLYNILQRNPQELAQRVAASINPQKYPDIYARTLNEARNQPDIDHINTAIEKGAQAVTEQERTISTETDPRVIQARTNQAVNTEAAKIRLQQTLSPDAFAGIPSPQVRAQAERSYQDYSNKYIDSMESAQGLHDLISQAQRGNKAAPGLISIAELRTYLNRVNRTELQAVGSNAGNLLDKVQGVIGGLVEGQPVPPDIMQGVDQIATMQQQAAQRKYGNQIGLMKTTYGRAPEPFQWQPHAGQQTGAAPTGQYKMTATGPGGHKIGSNDNGQTWVDIQTGKAVK